MLRLGALAVTAALTQASAMDEAMTQANLVLGWDDAKCTEADGQWTDVFGAGYNSCIYQGDYECVEVDADGNSVRIASSDAIGGCALDGACMDASTKAICKEYFGGSGVVLGVIMGLILSIAIGIIVYCCCCKGNKTDDDNYQNA